MPISFGGQKSNLLVIGRFRVLCLGRQCLEHGRFPGVDMVEIPDGRVDLRGILEGAVEGLELAGRAHLVDGVVDGRDGLVESASDGNGVPRQAFFDS